MIQVLKTRLLHWKKQWISLLFWLIFPVVLTCIIIQATSSIQEDSKVPIGVVLEDDSDFAMNLTESLGSSSLVRVKKLSEKDALHQLEKHELDSVFIIPDGYADQIRKGSRNRLVTGYASDLSMAYSPTKELLLSYVQQDTARSKAAYTVKQISENYTRDFNWTWDEIVEKSMEIQADEDLLSTTFSFLHASSPEDDENVQLWSTWGLWSVFALLATLLLFDWVIREKRSNVLMRLTFMQVGQAKYLITTLFVYLCLLFFFDITTMFVFRQFFSEGISLNLLCSLAAYRLTLTIGAFLLANMFKNMYVYYSLSFIITLIAAIISGAILPIDGIVDYISWMEYINPIQAFLIEKPSYISILLLVIWGIVWFVRKEKAHA